jgi:hypothetical protein
VTVNPVFVNELRQSVFRRRSSAIISALVIVGALLSMLAQLGSMRALVVYAPVVLLPLIVPAIASGAFAKEYEQQTWMDLYLTRLTNAQVVWGKFGAYVLQIAVCVLALAPSLVLVLLGIYSRKLSELRYDVIPLEWQLAAVLTTAAFVFKLLVSACLYVLLTMVCSRYSPNRRAALTSSYIALALYTGLGLLVWSMLGAFDYQVQMAEERAASPTSGFVPIELTPPGFMESFHLIFSGVVGIGSLVLLWVSLSEQRGYRGSGDVAGVTRSWQPTARRTRDAVT